MVLVCSSIKNMISSIIGIPNYLRRLQWHSVRRLLDPGSHKIILDLGAGPMHYASSIARDTGAYVIAADLCFHADHLIIARKNSVIPLQVDAQLLPLFDHSVDCILMSSLLHMVSIPENLLAECKRVLSREGYLVLSVPNHYRFIPKIMASPIGPIICRMFKLPPTHDKLVELLNKSFHVNGPQGYYSLDELTTLLNEAGFSIDKHEYSPRWLGSLLWEIAVMAYVRFGSISFHLLFLAYPIARLFEFVTRSSMGSEHIVKAVPNYD